MTTAVQGHEFRIRAATPLPGGTLRTLTRLSPVRSTLSLRSASRWSRTRTT
jgi:hypothetical protein